MADQIKHPGTPRVDACIEAVSARYPSPKSALYFEAVHQHIAPLAREMEREIAELRAALQAQQGDAAKPKCKGCNGHGLVGNILDTDTCPFCKGSGTEDELDAAIDAAMVQHGQRRAEEVVQHQQRHISELTAQLEGETIATDLAIKQRNRAEASLARLVAGVDALVPYGPAGADLEELVWACSGYEGCLADVIALLPAKAEAQSTSATDPALYAGIEKREPDAQDNCAAQATSPPAMGEELPCSPKSVDSEQQADLTSTGEELPDADEFFKEQLSESGMKKYMEGEKISLTAGGWCEMMEAYGRACMALRQPGAPEKDMSNTDIPQGDARGNVLEQLYAAWHREPCGDTLHAIGCAIQELQARIDPAMELRIVQLANQYLTSADYIWQGDIDQIMAFSGAVAAATAPVSQPAGQEPVAYVNGDELDNMLDDRTATIQAKRTGFRATALYTAPQPLPSPAGSEQEGDELAILKSKAFCLDEWLQKTQWVQDQISTFPINSLGKHRADVLREEVERLRAVQPKTGE